MSRSYINVSLSPTSLPYPYVSSMCLCPFYSQKKKKKSLENIFLDIEIILAGPGHTQQLWCMYDPPTQISELILFEVYILNVEVTF